jgi:ferrous iron transport protein A
MVQRLLEFGLLEGEMVEVIGWAPMGDPMEIRVGNTRLSVRKHDASMIQVSSVTPS